MMKCADGDVFTERFRHHITGNRDSPKADSNAQSKLSVLVLAPLCTWLLSWSILQLRFLSYLVYVYVMFFMFYVTDHVIIG